MQGQKLISNPILNLLPQRSILPETPHSMERRVHHELLVKNPLKFSSVVVHRIRNGVCLEGYLCSDSDSTDACHIARKVRGVNKVLNHLVVKNH
jgi:osmotically-inducible protein OsmY